MSWALEGIHKRYKMLIRSQGSCLVLGVALSAYFHACRHSRKNKILHWFEQIFASVSGEDQLLQLDELKQALGIHGVSTVHIIGCL